MAKTKKDNVENIKDSLSNKIAEQVSKTFEKELGKVVWNLDGPEYTDVIDWVSTGETMLDLAISNKPNGGLPVGRIVELTGLEGTGKSLMAAHVIAETQKRGGLGVFIDTEAAVSPEFFRSIGIDMSQLIYVKLLTIEDIFKTIEDIITSVRQSDSERLVTIVVDSVAGATTKVEESADYEKDGYATTKAILMSKALRKITNLIDRQRILLVFTNQLRMKLNAMGFGDPYTTSGGKALDFHSSVKIRLKSTGKLKQKIYGQDEVIGNKTEAIVTKNRVGPPYRKSKFELYFDSGIDKYSSWINVMKDYKIVKQSGAWYTYSLDKGDGSEPEEIKFQSKDFVDIMKDRPDVKNSMYQEICNKKIMVYKNQDETVRIIGEGNIILDEEDE